MKTVKQKEFKQLLGAIDKWTKANKGDVSFIGSFISFDKEKLKKNEDDIIKDDIILGYGGKEGLLIALKELQNLLKKDKKKFINW